jgi:CBS domain-containing protein/anti-sigma regulatory factor (Ser/Thr protein kinase)
VRSDEVDPALADEFTKIQELVYELKIEQVMTREVAVVSSDMLMRELMEAFRLNRISGCPVIDDGQLVGIVSLEDLIKAWARDEIETTVRDGMSAPVITVYADESVVEAVKGFSQHGVGRLPVVDRQKNLVGILTNGDITRGLLKAIQLDYHAEEISKYRASHIFEDITSDNTSLLLRYKVKAQDFDHGGEASSKIKRALERLGGQPQMVRRVAIATYEAELNIVIHADRGGEIIAEIQPEKIRILAIDHGPGIPDVKMAMKPGFSTASEWIRELGFGAGMGLSNIQRCADEVDLQSETGQGTRLEILFFTDVQRRSN